MKKYKIIYIYFFLVVINIISIRIFNERVFLLNYAIISLIINMFTLIVSFKIFNVDKNSIRLFLFFISILMTIIILENNYLISYYNQSTLDPVCYNWILILIHMVLMPFSDIFTVMYKIKMLKLAIIIIPIFILFSYIVYRKKIK